MTKETLCGTHCRVSQREVVVLKAVEEARTSHPILLDPEACLQIRMDEAKFEKDHPNYLTGKE